MENGISVYAGLGYGVDDNLRLIHTAANLGMKRLFTSANIPESSPSSANFFEEFTEIITAAITNGFEIIIDVSPKNINEFELDRLTLRLDDGFSASQIVELSQTRKIQLNASTVTNEFLTILLNLGANFSNISALHNFYPHIYTGLSTYFFESQNKILHDFGIKVGAFVATLDGHRRPPFGEGLSTLEDCRNLTADLAARFLAALGIDFIIIGDGLPTYEECCAVSAITDNEVVMSARLLTNDPVAVTLLSNKFTRRPDGAKFVIRAVEGRGILKSLGTTVMANNFQVDRNFGDITVDNENFGRYAGEVQIVADVLPADMRVNIVARIVEEEFFLISCIKPGQKFSFRFIT